MAIVNQSNQFEMSALKATIARGSNPFTLSVFVDPDQSGDLVPGDFVKISTHTNKLITVLKCAVTDVSIGVVLRSPKKNTFAASDAVEIGLFGSIVLLESSAAITAMDDLEYVVTGAKVKTAAGVNPICAVALTAAGGAGELVVCQIKSIITIAPTIVGGTINDCPIGAATPNTGAFTTLSASGAFAAKTVAGGPTPVAITPAATIALDPTAGDIQTLTPGEDETINIANDKRVAGQRLFLIITTSGTTSRTLTFGTNFKTTGTLATGTTNAKVFVICFVSNGTTYTEVSRTAAM